MSQLEELLAQRKALDEQIAKLEEETWPQFMAVVLVPTLYDDLSLRIIQYVEEKHIFLKEHGFLFKTSAEYNNWLSYCKARTLWAELTRGFVPDFRDEKQDRWFPCFNFGTGYVTPFDERGPRTTWPYEFCGTKEDCTFAISTLTGRKLLSHLFHPSIPRD